MWFTPSIDIFLVYKGELMEKGYTNPDIIVHYDVKLCIHAGECVRGLPQVFDPNKKPWIDPTQGTANAIASVIHKCPSGALRYERLDDGKPEQADSLSMEFVKDGPVYMRGDITLTNEDGSVIYTGTRVALCRCGESKNKPFCDSSHLSGFEAPAGSARLEP
jgi:uncharacterized Fe-S cluster protein YjdI/CDGSH-type Zn-finger protein